MNFQKDELLMFADEQASKVNNSSILSIGRRIAYIVNVGPKDANGCVVKHALVTASKLTQYGYDTYCFATSNQVIEVENDYLNDDSKNIKLIQSPRLNIIDSHDETSYLTAAIEKIVKWLTIYRPECVVASGSYFTGLPTWVAASKLSIPFFFDICGSESFEVEDFVKRSRSSGLYEPRNQFLFDKAQNVFSSFELIRDCLAVSSNENMYEGRKLIKAINNKNFIEELRESFELSSSQPNEQPLFSARTGIEGGSSNEEEGQRDVAYAAAQKAVETPQVSASPLDETVYIKPEHLTLEGSCKKNLTGTIKVPVRGATLEFTASVAYRLKSTTSARKAVLLFDFLDQDDSKIASVPGIGVAAVFKQHFRYLNANCESVDAKPQEVFKLKLPKNVVKVSVSVASLGISDEEQVELKIQGRCYNEVAIKKKKEQALKLQGLPKPALHDPDKKIRSSDLNVACILDELTSECMSHEVNMIKLTRENWQEQLEKTKADFLLVESCWRGNDGNWGTLTKGSGGGKKLGGLLRYCKEQAIPTVFWNKEDPPHYDKFGAVAALFDVAITTDINMVPNYKKDFGITAHALSFAAQPKIHNPSIGVDRINKAVFAGSYYSEREDRCNDFHDIVSDLETAGVGCDIFDRNHMSGIERFKYPEKYADNIMGKLPPEELWKVNNGYKYQINLNSVTGSSTMFARRVYESLASGTPVVSNASKGVSELFGDLVIMNDSNGNIVDKVRELEHSPEKYNYLAKAGVRRVMREHTYGHRVKEICELIGINITLDQPEVTALATVNSAADVERVKSIFWDQTYPNKKLFISLEKFTGAHVFLNQSDRYVSFAMKLGNKFYDNDENFYLSDRLVQLDLCKRVNREYLEDAVYWGSSDD